MTVLGAGCAAQTGDDEPGPEPGEDASTAGNGGGGGEQDGGLDGEQTGRLLVTADWLNRTLSLVDLDALVDGAATRDEVLVASIDLSAYSPGPLVAEITPDGKTALVSISAGFFALPLANILIGGATIPAGTGQLIFIDLESRQVVGEVVTGDHPTDIMITKDGTRAFVGHFSQSYVTVVDVAARAVIENVEVGFFSEELDQDDTGTVAAVSYSAAGNFRTFGTADMAGTLSPEVVLTGDAAGVAFFPGTKAAFMVEAPNVLNGDPAGYNVMDVSDPTSPVMLDEVRFENDPVIQYPAFSVPDRGTVMLPVTLEGKMMLREYALEDGKAVLTRTIDTGAPSTLFPAFSGVADGQGHVICPLPNEQLLTVTDLETEQSFSVPWGTAAGPTGVAIH